MLSHFLSSDKYFEKNSIPEIEYIEVYCAIA